MIFLGASADFVLQRLKKPGERSSVLPKTAPKIAARCSIFRPLILFKIAIKIDFAQVSTACEIVLGLM